MPAQGRTCGRSTRVRPLNASGKALLGGTLPTISLLISLQASLLSAAPPVDRAAPSQLLEAPTDGFSARCGTDGPWVWQKPILSRGVGTPTVYVCRGPTKYDRVFVIVTAHGRTFVRPEMALTVVESGLRSGSDLLFLVVRDAFLRTRAPVPPGFYLVSARYSAGELVDNTIEEVDGHVTAYLYSAKRLYAITALTSEDKEPPALRTVLTSFRIIEPPKPPKERRPPILGMYALGILVASWFGSSLVNLVVGRHLLNGWLIGAAVIAVALPLALGIMAVGSATGGELLYTLIELAIPLALAVGVGLVTRRKAARSGESCSGGRP